MNSIERTINKFRQAGYRITPQRRAIFNILVSDESHPNADDVFEKVRKKIPEISRTTVYNTLQEMVDLGILGFASSNGENVVRYDPNTDMHDHLYCVNCHKIIDIEFKHKQIEIPENETRDYQIVRQQVTFFGYCPECREKAIGNIRKQDL